ncbi:hypothetical protein J437_LFUL016453 [Ladona fulva]|uniref:C-type lectin domain-containing protein n=1 Tax=Ladona fulva TaxID=123851 RepID=A0A8K0P4R5_LADFU|nr:hypothetical protein J437_LFUL016453 [Ladona fulva]
MYQSAIISYKYPCLLWTSSHFCGYNLHYRSVWPNLFDFTFNPVLSKPKSKKLKVIMTRFLTFVFLATVLSLSEQTSELTNNEADELDLSLNIANFKTLSNSYTCIPGAGCYKFHNNSVTFAEAKRICESEGAFLPIVHSAREASALVAVYHPYYEPDKEWPRIGFGDFFGKGEFVTIYGGHINSTGYDNWYYGEPSTRYERNCGAINMEGKMGTQCCDCNIWFICQVLIT